jgi:hypothetical protein
VYRRDRGLKPLVNLVLAFICLLAFKPTHLKDISRAFLSFLNIFSRRVFQGMYDLQYTVVKDVIIKMETLMSSPEKWSQATFA